VSTNSATASFEAPCGPAAAFDIFTADIGLWWKRGTNYWNDVHKGLQLRIEPR
jgi:hypothetical protein